MYKILMAALVVVLSGFIPVDTGYSATGTWEGAIFNKTNPSDRVRVKFILNDENGKLSGIHYFYDRNWEELGVIRGERSGNYATAITFASGGFIKITGTFDGNFFKGTYYLYRYIGTGFVADLVLTRTNVQNNVQVPTNSKEN